jgi:16S rRNA (guanine966-N2)-methyltransferase
MRIIAGAWRGKRLQAPPGPTTRPTADRVRQAVFDMLAHAPWGGRALLDGAAVLDAFAGTGAAGLEALSRGAARAVFMDRDPQALAALRSNVAACGAGGQAQILATDVLRPPPGPGQTLVFLDPPYGCGLLPGAIEALRTTGWIIPGSVIVAETDRLERVMVNGVKLAQRMHGAAQVNVWRET